MPDDFSFGIEEEFFLVDARTKSVVRTMPQGFLCAAEQATAGRAKIEFLQSQIEILTNPHTDIGAARRDLRDLRHSLSGVAQQYGLAILACGTHPTAAWIRARRSEGERYDAVMDDLQMIGQRNMLCGMHVHVELPDPDRRVDVMTRMLPYLPLFVALSTSSPFWQSRPTGLMGYRLAAYDELPRTGVPELFRSNEEFDAYIAALVKAGVIPDSSYVWWAIRPSLKHPTLELRAPDSCTRIEDTIALTALWRVLARRLYRDRTLHRDLDAVSRAIVVENKWRAQRYGIHGTFASISGEGAAAIPDIVQRLVADMADDADALGCTAELGHCRTIAETGTSADRQVAVYEENGGSDNAEAALRAVAEWIAHTTLGESGTAAH